MRPFKNISRLFAALVVTTIAAPPLGLADEPVSTSSGNGITVKAQPLAYALQDFSEQSGLQVAYVATLADNVSTNGTHDAHTPAAALSEILDGTGLQYQFVNDDTVAIGPATTPENEAEDPGNSQTTPRSVLMAQASASSLEARDTATGVTTATEEGANRAEEESAEAITTIIVTGTHLRNAESATPTIALDREDFIEGGFSTLQDVFRNMPQNFTDITPVATFTDGVTGIASENTSRATGVSLRGLGPESTLVLVNGRRYPGAIAGRVFDISSIPLSAIERIDVITGGNSAIYGSDAVAGVVNLISRRSFDGVETGVSHGFSEGGNENTSAHVLFGLAADNGGVLASYDFAKQTTLDATEAGRIGGSPFGVVPDPGVFDIVPETERHSVFVAGDLDISDSLQLFADGHYSRNSTDRSLGYTAPFGALLNHSHVDAELIAGTAGLTSELPGSWSLDLTGTYGTREESRSSETVSDPPSLSLGHATSEVTQLTVLTRGTLLTLGDIAMQSALGVEYRDEAYRDDRIEGISRTVTSAFGEVQIPLVRNGLNPGLRRLEFNIAARYDDYSEFGDTFNPQLGAIWKPIEDLTLRGTYAKAFRAPSLFLQGSAVTSTQAFLQPTVDPVSPTGTSTVFIMFGTSEDLRPEEANTLTVGFDYSPPFAEDVQISASFFDVQYDGRLEVPASGSDRLTFLQNESRFATLIDRSPTEAEARIFYERAEAAEDFAGPGRFANTTMVPFDPDTQDFLTVFPDLVLFDNQRANIAVEEIQGFDLEIESRFETPVGALSTDLNAVYYFNYQRAVTKSSPEFSLLNETGKLTDFKARAHFGWEREGFGVHTYVNYIDGYQNPLVTPAEKIGSWTTVDLTLRYDSLDGGTGFLNDGFQASVAISNLFNDAPPFLDGNLFGTAFDSANHNIFGRVISLRLIKRW